MKHFYRVFSILFIAAIFGSYLTASADTKDADGFPIVYLRGTCNDWSTPDNYRFTRDGALYSLTITADNQIPEGEFKIADDDWRNFNFGAPSGNSYINESGVFFFTKIGNNFKTTGIYSGTISFVYDPAATELAVTFDINTTPLPLTSGTLPVMYINVFTDSSLSTFNNEINDYNLAHKDYFTNAVYWLDINGCEWLEELGAKSVGSEDSPLPLQIKARGNWSRTGFSKKPFKIKLDKKQDLLALTPEKSKHYTLLAHADDTYGFMRNFVNFNLGQRIGLPWTPGMQPVELIINGNYRGLYFLTESIRVGDGRIDITELDDNVSDPELVSGGYIVELDNYDEDNQIRLDEISFVRDQQLDRLRITFDTPEKYSALQERFITDQFSAINNAIGANNDNTWTYLDLDDAARYYLVEEITSHVESFHGSTYLFRDYGEDQKWHFSPLWDAGNAFNGYTDMFLYNCDPFGNTWIPSMRENSRFNQKVEETWLWFMQNEYPGIFDDIDEFASHISTAAKYDHDRWKNEPVPSGGQPVANNSKIDDRVAAVKDHLNRKTNWLKSQFGDFSSGNYSEPSRDDTPAAPLPDYVTTSITDISDFDKDAPEEYYNLQGIRVLNPVKGQIYIVKKGARSFKKVF